MYVRVVTAAWTLRSLCSRPLCPALRSPGHFVVHFLVPEPLMCPEGGALGALARAGYGLISHPEQQAAVLAPGARRHQESRVLWGWEGEKV